MISFHLLICFGVFTVYWSICNIYSYPVLFFYTLADEFKDIVHSLDVWHKSKNIRKCLIQVNCTLYYEDSYYWPNS